MTTGSVLLALLAACTAVLAWALAAGRLTRSMWPFYRPIVLLLSLGVFADASRTALRIFVLDPARSAVEPFRGAARVVFHISQALLLSWPAALLAAAFVVFLRRPPWPIAVGWVIAALAFAALYPWLRDGNLFATYAALSLATCVAIWAIALSRLGEAWIQHHVSLLLITLGEAVANTAYLFGDPIGDWGLARTAHGMAFAAILCYQTAQIVRYWRWRAL